MSLHEQDKQWLEEQFSAFSKRMMDLVTEVKESLEREIGDVKDATDRMDVRLGKIAAGAHYVTRLVEWSEYQDAFQAAESVTEDGVITMDLFEQFQRRIVKREVLDIYGDEVTLECGHVVVRVCPPAGGESVVCSECLNDWVELEKAKAPK